MLCDLCGEKQTINMSFLIWQLIDSGFPAGGFAHSGGLEAGVQHGLIDEGRTVLAFARQALSHAGRSSMPFVTAARDNPRRMKELDRHADIFLTSSIANRSSRAQGRALLVSASRSFPHPSLEHLDALARREGLCFHYAPLFGAVFNALDIDPVETQRAFLFMTIHGITSAAVRLGVIGAYEAQNIQMTLDPDINRTIERCGRLAPADAAQTAPLIDLCQSTQDRLYSRLFQS